MKFLLTSNPAFFILPCGNNEYVFYNSLQHRASSLNQIEMGILDLYYTYQDKDYIINMFDNDKKPLIKNALNKIDSHKLLLCEDIKDSYSTKALFPSSYYLHLTYKCNLRCTYCYNKSIRENQQSIMSLQEWKTIIDKIAPYAKSITLTGGEFFLYPNLIELLQYIKQTCPQVIISGISNGMHDFAQGNLSKAFEYISAISLSCDSISKEGERRGFKPELYRHNILWIKQHYPNVQVSLASTVTSSNLHDIHDISTFCQANHCNLSRTILIPGNSAEVELMPSIEEHIKLSSNDPQLNKITQLQSASFHCGAGKSICSIDPYGNAYPCQSLHYNEFLMGNILTDNIDDLRYFGKEGSVLKSVNDFAICSKCKVKYICGGGCPATGYRFYGGKIKPNHLLCRLNYINSIEQLKSLDNRI